ncbi:MFS transporter [Paraburkholderia sediminicola]|uniref:MFS transporter n=1 Tax=Paraburkholderia sediminicola TaxID=458836 RepID=UPI0038B77351
MATITTSRPSLSAEERKVVFGSSLGTVFEWYDFFIYGSVAAVIAKRFFAGVSPTYGFIFALLGFAAGFIVRPLGAMLFGRLGDIVGRKHTFLLTIVVMGAATFLTGVLPTYEQVGVLAPVLLIVLRMVQGLAIGGEYGGAATYVAEHAPKERRGYFTAWIQTTGTAGMVLSLLVVMASIKLSGPEFDVWGWRIPFLVSVILLGISLYIRLSMSESPVFEQMKAQGRSSKAPLKEAFGRWENLRAVLLALFGLCAGQTVVYFTGQFFPLFFLTQTLKVDIGTANLMVIVALAVGCPFFLFFGWLSDRIGRKPILLVGLLLPALTFYPIYRGLTHFANPALAAAQATAPVSVLVDSDTCSFQMNPTGTKKFTSSCDIAKLALAQASANYSTQSASAGSNAVIVIGSQRIESYDAKGLAPADAKAKEVALKSALGAALKSAGYPLKAAPEQMNIPGVMTLLILLMIYAAMSYSVLGAMLVEMFPARIRYTSLSLPYHIATGWFGGLQPTVSFALIASSGNIYSGLWYPSVIAGFTFIVAALFIRETRGVDIDG